MFLLTFNYRYDILFLPIETDFRRLGGYKMTEVLRHDEEMSCLDPDCSGEIFIKAGTKKGDTVGCEECGCEFEVISLSPVELEPLSPTGAD